jgi:hypothetical protein
MKCQKSIRRRGWSYPSPCSREATVRGFKLDGVTPVQFCTQHAPEWVRTSLRAKKGEK